MQDYIMRLIQQVAQMVAVIMGHRKAGRGDEAAEEIERACLQTAGVPLTLIRQASPEALRQFLQPGGPQRLTRDFLLAELLLQDAEIQQENGCSAASLHSKAHAFCLISDSVDALTVDDMVHYHARLDALAVELKDAPLDAYVRQKVLVWLERSGTVTGFTGSDRSA
jgi:hypothetical protein